MDPKADDPTPDVTPAGGAFVVTAVSTGVVAAAWWLALYMDGPSGIRGDGADALERAALYTTGTLVLAGLAALTGPLSMFILLAGVVAVGVPAVGWWTLAPALVTLVAVFLWVGLFTPDDEAPAGPGGGEPAKLADLRAQGSREAADASGLKAYEADAESDERRR